MRRMMQRMGTARTERLRTSGEPTSRNGASSFHLFWDLPPQPLIEVSATCEVLVPPSLRRLYFWAIQVDFASGNQVHGGAHLGIQWNPRFPGGGAVNWGGYASSGRRLLRGSDSPLSSARRDPNTRDYRWIPGHRYELRIGPPAEAPEGRYAWPGSITHLETGEETLVRHLFTPGGYLLRPVVWTESFARCEHPSVSVRWSGLRAVDDGGRELRPPYVRVNYQTAADGGCDNTTVAVDELGLLQITSVERQIPQDALLPVPGPVVSG
jgi:hypothetical protein